MSEINNEFLKFVELVEKDGALNSKTKHLIGMAIAITKNCKPCIDIHKKAAIKLGATSEEISETSWVAVLMDGGPSYIHTKDLRTK